MQFLSTCGSFLFYLTHSGKSLNLMQNKTKNPLNHKQAICKRNFSRTRSDGAPKKNLYANETKNKLRKIALACE